MNGITNIGEVLNDLEIDRDEWQARAEAAERRVTELEKDAARHHEDYDGLYQDYEEAKAKWEGTADIGAELYTLRQRVQELESQLAAKGFRPFPPPVGEWVEIQSIFKAQRTEDDYYHIPSDESTWQGWRPIIK